VPRQQEPPKTPRYDVEGIQSTGPTKTRRGLTIQEVAGAYPSLVAKRPELLDRLSKRGSTYDVQAIQGGGPPAQRRTPRQVRAIENKAFWATTMTQLNPYLYDWADKYTKGMVFFNALPQAVVSLTNKPLQAMINRGPPALQQAILRTFGPWPGQGAARLVDTAIQAAVPPLAGLGLANYFLGGKARSANIPENRPQTFWNITNR